MAGLEIVWSIWVILLILLLTNTTFLVIELVFSAVFHPFLTKPSKEEPKAYSEPQANG